MFFYVFLFAAIACSFASLHWAMEGSDAIHPSPIPAPPSLIKMNISLSCYKEGVNL